MVDEVQQGIEEIKPLNKPKLRLIRRNTSIIIPKSFPIDFFITIKDKETHYEVTKKHSYSINEPSFNVLTAEATNSRYPFKIIDPFFMYDEGTTPVCHRSIPVKNLDSFKRLSGKGWDENFTAEMVTMAIDKKKYFSDSGLNWKKTIDFLAYQGLGKDPVIVEILKALTFPMPNAQRYQSLNPNTIMITETKTAKTTTLTELGWRPYSGTLLTVPGLFGGGGREYKTGVAGGWGVLGIDECGKVKLGDDGVGILEFCLEYLQKGTMERIHYGSKSCNGTKTFCLFSNPEETKESLFPYYTRNLLRRLGALSEQVSSRLGILAFGCNYKQVWQESTYKREHLEVLRLLIKEVWIEKQKKWMKLLDSYNDWFCKTDEDLYKQFKDVNYMDDSIYRFVMNGIGKFQNRSKCAAVKLAVINNLDKFYNIENIKHLKKELADDVCYNWEFVKKINLNSIGIIASAIKMDKDTFFGLCDKERLDLSNISDLSNAFDVPWSTMNDWVNVYNRDKDIRRELIPNII